MAFSSPHRSRLAQWLSTGRRWVVLAMLAALHFALVAEPGGVFQRMWLLVHFGLFLTWQPFFAAERELEWFSIVLLLAVIATTIYFVSGWMIVMWLLILMGILGGRVFTVQSSRRNRFYLVAFGYVMAVLLLWAVPALIIGAQHAPPFIANFAQRILPLVLALLIVLPLPDEDAAAQVFDFFYAVLVFQLGVVLVLGSLVLMRQWGGYYMESVAFTVLGFGLALFVFAVLWNPIRGFGGLRTYFSAYLLSVGMPFELWMRRIAELAETEPNAQRFLERALDEVAALPWMRGGSWRSPDGAGSFGVLEGHATRFDFHRLELVFHTAIELSPALFLHMRLLAQVVGEFHEGKRRETALRHNAYLQAVHETGARLTHDVKNLLQSLYALTSIAQKADRDYTPILGRQLPELTKRLHATLEKLRSPEIAASDVAVPAAEWWERVGRRHSGSGVAFTAAIRGAGSVPGTLFDSFIENALDNAFAKRAADPGLAVSVGFTLEAGRAEVRVCDSGAAVPAPIAQKLLREPIERGSGLGIGLFHLARQAAQGGYALALADNRDGAVCFSLAGPARAASPGNG